MKLTERQLKHLRRMGHALKPVVTVGGGGASPAVVAELDQALEHHELVKVRVRAGDRERRDAALETLLEGCRGVLVQRIGHTALIYRRAEEPRLALPAAGA